MRLRMRRRFILQASWMQSSAAVGLYGQAPLVDAGVERRRMGEMERKGRGRGDNDDTE
jgi:hypothetical protein